MKFADVTDNFYLSIIQLEFFSWVKNTRVLGKFRHGLEDVLAQHL